MSLYANEQDSSDDENADDGSNPLPDNIEPSFVRHASLRDVSRLYSSCLRYLRRPPSSPLQLTKQLRRQPSDEKEEADEAPNQSPWANQKLIKPLVQNLLGKSQAYKAFRVSDLTQPLSDACEVLFHILCICHDMLFNASSVRGVLRYSFDRILPHHHLATFLS